MIHKFFVVGMLLLAATGCGGPIESEPLAEQAPSEAGTLTPPASSEVSDDGREVNALACNLQTYVGMGSCHQTCNLTGALCSNGTKQWSCYAINYEHWKSSTGANQYRARGWENGWVTKCQNTNPVNCPGFCG